MTDEGEWRVFICRVAQSNKYWKCRYGGGVSYEKRWGRIGGHETADTKSFGSAYAAQAALEKEIAEKTNPSKKGGPYVEETTDKLVEEVDIAKTIGTRWKIDRVEFLAQECTGGNAILELSDQYYPSCGVYVELLESWDKSRAYMVINKNRSFQFYDASISGGKVRLGGYRSPDGSFVSGIKKMISGLVAAVEEVCVKFGAVGCRILSLGNDDGQPSEVASAYRAVAAKTGVSQQVVNKLASVFAAVGNRQLEL